MIIKIQISNEHAVNDLIQTFRCQNCFERVKYQEITV